MAVFLSSGHLRCRGAALQQLPHSEMILAGPVPCRRLRDTGAVIVGVARQPEAGLGTTGTVSAYGVHSNP